ncbi:MAG: RidA family protein [Pigmentiphaga sp.]|uniref:RidA family protein n=1 Tax=Pigmentiphaga sp. TaxID=1977564 RepID=UPI0029B00B73|nr:RidA family protein [Pigmentiphaga sp.]MDX3904387.1 RidA family protein [Pigmentiphaga sp.]
MNNASSVARRVIAPSVPERETATWSNCLVLGNEIAMSGVTAHPQATAVEPPLGTYEQTLVVLGKIRALVEAAGAGVQNIYKLVIYVTDIKDKDEVGRARKEFFQSPYPCSTLVEVRALVFPGLTVEIDAFARLDVALRTDA